MPLSSGGARHGLHAFAATPSRRKHLDPSALKANRGQLPDCWSPRHSSIPGVLLCMAFPQADNNLHAVYLSVHPVLSTLPAIAYLWYLDPASRYTSSATSSTINHLDFMTCQWWLVSSLKCLAMSAGPCNTLV